MKISDATKAMISKAAQEKFRELEMSQSSTLNNGRFGSPSCNLKEPRLLNS